MKISGAVIAVLTALVFLVAFAAQKPWDGSYTLYRMHYLLYSGTLGEAQPPTRTEQRLSFAIQGQLAKQMFDSIGPDLKLSCGTTLGMRQSPRPGRLAMTLP